jgi:hypothetical protein
VVHVTICLEKVVLVGSRRGRKRGEKLDVGKQLSGELFAEERELEDCAHTRRAVSYTQENYQQACQKEERGNERDTHVLDRGRRD